MNEEKKNPRGYRRKWIDPTTEKPELRSVYVGCMRCRKTWHEMQWRYPSDFVINGPEMYDACSDCITPKEAKENYE